jgi:stage II sporulation protein P
MYTDHRQNAYEKPHRQRVYEKLPDKAANLIKVIVLSIIAVFVGIQFGNLWYHLDIKIIDNIDTENFRKTINFSMPIIETVYNSGKSSVSLSSEINELFTGIFGFDFHEPATIFNVQSPLFRVFYKKQKANGSDADSRLISDGTDDRKGNSIEDGPGQGDAPSESGSGQGAVPPESDAGQGHVPSESGNGKDGREEKGTGDRENGGTDGKGDPAGKGKGSPDGSDSREGDPGGSSTESSINTDTYADAGDGKAGPGTKGDGKGDGSALQNASSISWEMEYEDKDDRTGVVEVGQIAIKNHTRYKIDIEKLLKKPLDLDLSKKGPKVLVYHTHTSESYVLKESDLGKKGVSSFNSNPRYNVVRVGEELARHFRKYGVETLHNGTVHDKVRDAAYSASVETLESYKKSYPSIQVYIDVHRDAVNSDKPKLRMTTEINGKTCAQIMFVVGAEGTLPHPKWQENLSFVLKLQQKLNEKYPGLAKPVWIVEARYNQHISTQSILIEVGGDGNLLSECLESTKYLAEALHEVIEEWGRDGS